MYVLYLWVQSKRKNFPILFPVYISGVVVYFRLQSQRMCEILRKTLEKVKNENHFMSHSNEHLCSPQKNFLFLAIHYISPQIILLLSFFLRSILKVIPHSSFIISIMISFFYILVFWVKNIRNWFSKNKFKSNKTVFSDKKLHKKQNSEKKRRQKNCLTFQWNTKYCWYWGQFYD